MIRKKIPAFCGILLVCAAAFAQVPEIAAQDKPQNPETDKTRLTEDPVTLIGTTLTDLFARHGAPKYVYPVRGVASWQDDVVFVYDAAEFFVSTNRVWQLKLHSAYGLKEGDPKAQADLVMGPGQDFDGYSLFNLPSKVWPIMLRINWDASRRIQALYVYRSDF
jgi:hypothetical protein